MAGRYEVRSVGGSIWDRLHALMLEQEASKRQSALDGIAVDDRMRLQARQDAADRRQAAEQQQQDADRLAKIVGPGADLTPAQADALKGGGYGVDQRTTLPARVGVPGVVAAQQDLAPAPYSRRAETFTEQQARQVREQAEADKRAAAAERAGAREDTQAFTASQAEATRAAAKERSDADRQMKELIAHMSNSNSVETRALANQMKALQIQAAQDKLDAARSDRSKAAKERVAGRNDVRDLAQSIIDDPALSSITGAFDARTPNLRSGSVDVQARLDQLKNKLSLAGRSQLKGQGQISDFEGRMLASAMTAIDPRAGAENVKKYLRQIVDVMSEGGDEGSGGNNSGGRVRRYDPATGQLK